MANILSVHPPSRLENIVTYPPLAIICHLAGREDGGKGVERQYSSSDTIQQRSVVLSLRLSARVSTAAFFFAIL